MVGTRKLRVLFLGAGKRASMAHQFILAGKRMDLDLDIFSYERDPFLPVAEFATVVLGKTFQEPELFDDLVNLIKENQIDIVVPFHDAALEVASRLKDVVFTPVSSTESVHIFGNKKSTASYLRSVGIPTPSEAVAAPAIAKPIYGSSSQGIIKFNDDESLFDFQKSTESTKYEIQELCSGPELSVDAYVSMDGKFRQFVPRLRIEVLGGEATKSQTINEPRVETISNELCKKANLSGALTVQFIWDDRDQAFKIMEVNLRFGGGALTSILAGVPWPEIVLRDFMGLPITTYEYDHNYLMVRSFREFGFSLTEESEK